MSTNLLRAEKVLNFPNNKSFKARMSLDTIMRIEEVLGMSILKLGNKLAQGDVTMAQIIQILTLSIRAGGSDIQDNEVKQLVSEIGLMDAIKKTGELLAIALHVEDEKKSRLTTS